MTSDRSPSLIDCRNGSFAMAASFVKSILLLCIWFFPNGLRGDEKNWLPGTEIVGRSPQDYTATQKSWITERKQQRERTRAELDAARHSASAYQKAVSPLRAIYDKDRAVFGAEHVETLDSLDQLIAAHYWARRFKEAKLLQEDAVAIASKLFGSKDYRTLEEQNQLERFKVFIARGDEVAGRFVDANRVLNSLQNQTFQGTSTEKLKASQQVLATYASVLGDQSDYVPIAALTLARVQMEVGLLEDSDQFAKDVDAVARYKFGTLNPLVASCRLHQSHAARKVGRYQAAERFARQSLEIYDQIEGYNYAERAWARYWHAVLLIKLADNGNAESDLKAMLDDAAHVSNDPAQLALFQCAAAIQTAVIQRMRQQYAEALAKLDEAQQALARYKPTNVSSKANWQRDIDFTRIDVLHAKGDVTTAMAKLQELMKAIPSGSEFDEARLRGTQIWAVLAAQSKDFDGAWTFAQEAFEFNLKQYGASHPITRNRYNDLRFIAVEYANELLKASKFEEAVAVVQVIEQAAKRLYNEDDPERMMAVSRLEDFQHLANLPPDIRTRCQQIFRLTEEIAALQKSSDPSKDEPGTASTSPSGQSAKAEVGVQPQIIQRRQQIVQLRRELFPKDSIATAEALVKLSVNLLLDGRTADAQSTVQSAADIVERRAGVENRLPVYAEILHVYAICLSNQSQTARAIALLQRSRILTLSAYGPHSPKYKNVLERLATLLDKEGNYAATESVYHELVLDAERNGQSDTPVHISRVGKLAFALFWQNKFAEAAQLFERSIDYHLASTSGNPRTAADHRYRLAQCYLKTNRSELALETIQLHNAYYGELMSQAKDASGLAYDLALGKSLEGSVDVALQKLAEAEQAYASAIELFREAGKMDTSDAQSAMNEIERVWLRRSVEHKSRGEFEKSLVYHEQLLKQRLERFGSAHPFYGDAEAGIETERRLVLLDESNRQEIIDCLAAINAIGEIKDDLAAATRLKELREKTDALLKGPNGISSPTYELEFNLRLKLLDYATAEALCKQWNEAYSRRFAGKPYALHAVWQQRLGLALFRQGRFDESSHAYQSALTILEPLNGLGISTQTMQNEIRLYLGRSLLRAGKRSEADTIIRSTHANLTRQGNLATQMMALDHLCDLLVEQQDWVELHRRAEELGRVTTAVEGPNGRSQRFAISYLARAQMQLGYFDEAAKSLDQLQSIDVLAGMKGGSLSTVQLRGRLAHLKKDYAAAERFLKAFSDAQPGGLPIQEKLDHSLLVGYVARDAGNMQSWRDQLARSQALSVDSGAMGIERTALELEQARYELVSGNLPTAKDLLARACERGWEELQYALKSGTEAGQLVTQNRLRERLDLWLSCPPNQVSAEEAYQQVLRWKGVVFHRQRQLAKQLRDPQQLELANLFRLTTGQLTSLWLTVPSEKDLPVWQGRLSLLRAERESLEQELVKRAATIDPTPPGLAQILDALPEDVAVVDYVRYMHTQADLQTDSYQVMPRYAAFVLRKGKPVQRFDTGDATVVDDLVEKWRTLRDWHKASNDEEFQKLFAQASQDSERLCATIWTPMEAALADSDTVLVSPDGRLAAMPFAALIDREGDYLLVKHGLATVPFVSSIPDIIAARRQARDAQTQSLYLVTDVAFGGKLGKDESITQSEKSDSAAPVERAHLLGFFRPLAAGKLELPALRKMFEESFPKGQVVTSTGSAATESAFMRHAKDAHWLYLSTHGYYMPDMWSSTRWNQQLGPASLNKESAKAPTRLSAAHELFPPNMLSGITFAGVNDVSSAYAEDGLYSSWELTSLPLNAELVVVSACQTAEGNSMDGQGVASFQQATHLSGCRSTLSTLWSVEDTQSRLLTSRVLWNLWDPKRRMSKVAALRDAQIWFLLAARKGKDRNWDNYDPSQLDHLSDALPPTYQIPTCWTGFVLSGDWE